MPASPKDRRADRGPDRVPSEPPLEQELKFPCEDLDALAARLGGAGAELISQRSREANWVLDRSGALERAGELLRVRVDGSGASLTFKGPARFEGGTKIRVERETAVSDPEEILAILAAIGLDVRRRYEKERETWRLDGVEVCLDRTPIGEFVEFEGAGAARVAQSFGFEPTAAEPRSYLELYRDYLRDHPEAPRDMVFR